MHILHILFVYSVSTKFYWLNLGFKKYWNVCKRYFFYQNTLLRTCYICKNRLLETLCQSNYIHFHGFHKSSCTFYRWLLWDSLVYKLGSLRALPLHFKESLCYRTGSLYSIQFSSVSQLCLTLCNPVDCSMPGLPVHHQLPEFTQTHVHWVGNASQPPHILSSPSPPTFSLSQHQGLFIWVSPSNQVAKVLEFQLQHQSF